MHNNFIFLLYINLFVIIYQEFLQDKGYPDASIIGKGDKSSSHIETTKLRIIFKMK